MLVVWYAVFGVLRLMFRVCWSLCVLPWLLFVCCVPFFCFPPFFCLLVVGSLLLLVVRCSGFVARCLLLVVCGLYIMSVVCCFLLLCVVCRVRCGLCVACCSLLIVVLVCCVMVVVFVVCCFVVCNVSFLSISCSTWLFVERCSMPVCAASSLYLCVVCCACVVCC